MAKLASLMVYVTEMAPAVAFYGAVLDSAPQVDSPHWSQFDLGNGTILGLHPSRDGKVSPSAGWTPSFRYDDLAPVRERAVAAGGTLHGYHDIPGGVILSVADPDGNLVDLQQDGVTCAQLGVESH